MLTFAVCDNDAAFARMLANKINSICLRFPDEIDCKIITFSSGEDVLNYVKSKLINVLFLDIDMPKLNGFELAEILCKKYPSTIIVFVSAFDELVYTSIQFSPFRFMRKSRLKEELVDTLEKIMEKCLADNRTKVFRTVEKDVCIHVKNILYIESQKNYYEIHCLDGIYRCRGTLSDVETELGEYDFFRAHPSVLVNIANIYMIHPSNVVELMNHHMLYVSRRRTTELKERFMEYSRKKVIV